MFPEIGFSTTTWFRLMTWYYSNVRGNGHPRYSEMDHLASTKSLFPGRDTTLFFDSDYTGSEDFNHTSLTGRIFEGFTVTYVALQLAYLMGIREAILIGVDHNFATKGPANSVVVSSGADPNHFSGSYFGQGFKWQLPDLDGSERAYQTCTEGLRS